MVDDWGRLGNHVSAKSVGILKDEICYCIGMIGNDRQPCFMEGLSCEELPAFCDLAMFLHLKENMKA